MNTIIILIILVVVIAGIVFFLKSKKDAAPEAKLADAVPKADTRQDDPEQEFKKILDALLSLNILLRKDQGLTTDMIKAIEAIIDDLVVVIPQMMERYPAETLTYEIKKIGQTHLFKTVKEYLDLSQDSRNNQLEIFKKTIDSLHEVSHRSRNIVEKNETAEFKTMANFLAGKFS
ncbi:MAG: hypothetical protein GY729_01765 [Desulfobacteraceae bacterium]|nr:hypothetical protein [Desulfobacteraceae bacterium]